MRFTPLASSTRTLALAEHTRGTTADPVAEIVTFRLVANTDPAAFIQAASDMSPFLKNTGAAVSRTLSQDKDGLWTDHIVWTSLQAAQTASDKIMHDAGAMPFMHMIDPETVTMRHAHIRFSIALE